MTPVDPSEMKTITCLINAASSEMLLDGLASFQEQFGRRFRTAVYYAHEIEEERVSLEAIRSDLESADLVLLDIRGAGRAASLASSLLSGTPGDVVVLMGGSPEILALVRMGTFSLAKPVARDHRQHHRRCRVRGDELLECLSESVAQKRLTV